VFTTGWGERIHPDTVTSLMSSSSVLTTSPSKCWDRVKRWARRKHRRITLKTIRRRCCNGGWWPVTPEIALLNPAKVGTTRYRYRGTAIPAPWPAKG
jgi:RNA-directed DNA polymerase